MEVRREDDTVDARLGVAEERSIVPRSLDFANVRYGARDVEEIEELLERFAFEWDVLVCKQTNVECLRGPRVLDKETPCILCGTQEWEFAHDQLLFVTAHEHPCTSKWRVQASTVRRAQASLVAERPRVR
ncbi:hypothetical protein AKJ09_00545 [Labilithrix luteola]|uniref:Uncharacterized protein n=1 Tax=Labilithrix luteola TaxID=1391654 RepID=A0A0K1PKG3_9BACT|nr:hypothetical protein AKJ09_00545 [Labilithrix luteola]